MALTAGPTPTDSNGARAGATGYVPGTGVVVAQMGPATADPASGAGNQLSAAQIIGIGDGIAPGTRATVAAFHNLDNQSFPSAATNGLFTGGVAQILNANNALDRQREVGLDGISSVGVAAGGANFAQQFLTTVPTTGTITSGQTTVATVTPAAMLGIQVGAVVTVDTGASAETALVTALPTASTATLVPANGAPLTPSWKFNHTPSYQITGFLYNQERDAAGELDGASGKGTAVAAEYEYNGGGPGTGNYDRARNLQGKGLQTASISAGGGTASVSMTLASVTGLTPGQQILLTGGSAPEAVYVAINYTVGSTTVPIQSAIQNGTQTTATWSAFAAQGPDVNEFLIDGEGTEFISLYNPATKRGNLLHGQAGVMHVAAGGRVTTAIAAGTSGDTVIKASAGKICRILVTTLGTNAMSVFDNASTHTGTIIAQLAASAPVGTYDFQMPAANGITVQGNASNPAVTIGWA